MRHIPLFAAALFVWSEARAAGGIATDGSLGPARSLSGAKLEIPQSLGQTVGANLFHGFSAFNVDTGQTVTFTGADNLENVVSRVTGGEVSNIDGLLKSAIGQADFYLINPAGVTFGPNARIDVPAAFHVSTADALKFADGAAFGASDPNASRLSGAAPAAFGFLGASLANNGLIAANGAQLSVRAGQSLDLVAGSIGIASGALLEAPAGEIRLGALQGAAEAGLITTADGVLPLPAATPSETNAGNISVRDSLIDVSGDGGGRVAVWGGTGDFERGGILADNLGPTDATAARGTLAVMRQLSMDDFVVRFDALGSGTAGSVSAEIVGRLEILAGGAIAGGAIGTGSAGTARIRAGTVRIDGNGDANGLTGIVSIAGPDSLGDAGSVGIVAAGALEILNGGEIVSSTFASGDAATVTVKAGAIRIDGNGLADGFTGIASRTNSNGGGNAGRVSVTSSGTIEMLNGGEISSDTFGSGDAGPANVESSGALKISNGGIISSDTFASGDAGSVTVRAASLEIDGNGNENVATGIFSNANRDSSGDAGAVTAETAGLLETLNGGRIANRTLAAGDAGTVTVKAGALRIDGGGLANLVTGIASDAYSDSSGDAGRVVAESLGSLEISNGGEISSSAFSSGDAGAVTVKAGAIKIDGYGLAGIFTGIVSTANRNSSGNAGTVSVESSGRLDMSNGGGISSAAFASGDAGSVTVKAGTIKLAGNGFPTGIISDATRNSSGNAGRVTVESSGLLEMLDGGRISSVAFASGNAGTVTARAGAMRIDGNGNAGGFTGITSQAAPNGGGDAGRVSAETRGSLRLLNGGAISSNTYGPGKAGAVTVASGGDMTVDGGNGDYDTFIGSQALQGSSGQTGQVRVTAGQTLSLLRSGKISILNDATVTDPSALAQTRVSISAADIVLRDGFVLAVARGNADAGDIDVRFGGNMSLNGGSDSLSAISTNAVLGRGGTIRIAGGGLLRLRDSAIFTTAHAGNADGGDIDIRADALIMETGLIQANANGGKGGNISIEVGASIPDGNLLAVGGTRQLAWRPGSFGLNIIQAASNARAEGTIVATAPQLNLSGVLANLGGSAFDAGALRPDYCFATGNGSLLVLGRGALPKRGRELAEP